MDDYDLVPEGCQVVVTQPRRIAAITIAERIAQERGERVGGAVGYQYTELNINFRHPTSLLGWRGGGVGR